jgi:hypothetical protein
MFESKEKNKWMKREERGLKNGENWENNRREI